MDAYLWSAHRTLGRISRDLLLDCVWVCLHNSVLKRHGVLLLVVVVAVLAVKVLSHSLAFSLIYVLDALMKKRCQVTRRAGEAFSVVVVVFVVDNSNNNIYNKDDDDDPEQVDSMPESLIQSVGRSFVCVSHWIDDFFSQSPSRVVLFPKRRLRQDTFEAFVAVRFELLLGLILVPKFCV